MTFASAPAQNQGQVQEIRREAFRRLEAKVSGMLAEKCNLASRLLSDGKFAAAETPHAESPEP
ncbi:hypothetical protein EON79_11605, partial [bacterium]